MKEKIKFEDLNGWLKTAVVFMYIMMGIWGIAFLYGFFGALAGVI